MTDAAKTWPVRIAAFHYPGIDDIDPAWHPILMPRPEQRAVLDRLHSGGARRHFTRVMLMDYYWADFGKNTDVNIGDHIGTDSKTDCPSKDRDMGFSTPLSRLALLDRKDWQKLLRRAGIGLIAPAVKSAIDGHQRRLWHTILGAKDYDFALRQAAILAPPSYTPPSDPATPEWTVLGRALWARAAELLPPPIRLRLNLIIGPDPTPPPQHNNRDNNGERNGKNHHSPPHLDLHLNPHSTPNTIQDLAPDSTPNSIPSPIRESIENPGKKASKTSLLHGIARIDPNTAGAFFLRLGRQIGPSWLRQPH